MIHKSIWIFVLMCLLSLKDIGQTVFLPSLGTNWQYTYKNKYNSEVYNNKITYIADSLSPLGENVKILTAQRVFFHNNPQTVSQRFFIKQRNDSVFLWHSVWPTWILYINYAAQIGQSWYYTFMTHPGLYPVYYQVKLLAKSTTTINNVPVKTMDVKYILTSASYSAVTYTATIYERLGNINSWFNFDNFKRPLDSYTLQNDTIDGLLCYQDNSIGLYQHTSLPCDFSNILNTEEIDVISQTRIHPNPFSAAMNVEVIEPTEVNVYDLQGRLVLVQQVESGSTKINTSGLQNGIYLIKASSKSGHWQAKLVRVE